MTTTRKRTVGLWLLGDLRWRGVAPFLLTLTLTMKFMMKFITMTHAFPSPRYHHHHHHQHYSHHQHHHPIIETALKATCNFVNLHYMEFLTPTTVSLSLEPPVLFLHGLLGSKRNFASLGASLASQLDNKRRILAMDLRNHGTRLSNGTQTRALLVRR